MSNWKQQLATAVATLNTCPDVQAVHDLLKASGVKGSRDERHLTEKCVVSVWLAAQAALPGNTTISSCQVDVLVYGPRRADGRRDVLWQSLPFHKPVAEAIDAFDQGKWPELTQ